ncbi:MAG: glycosyltransferase, partial [Armatimonadetes bacterium]|nr:glycosyltransferase [Armatimonadota bacterium]
DALASGEGRIVAIHQANTGPAAARNAALARARGAWLAYIDSDDVWFPDTLAAYAAFIDAHPDAKFLYGYRHRLNEDGSITELPGEFQDAPTGVAELFERMFLSHLCVCYRRELIDLAGPYDPALRSCEDYDLYLRIGLHCRFEPLGLPTGLRRRHGTNLSRQTGYSRLLEAEVLRRFVERQGGSAVLDGRRVAWRLGRLYYAAGRQYFKACCYRQALGALALARRYRRTFNGAAVALMARCLLPFGRTDARETPHLQGRSP